jgi:hypoxanthine phosphoribosyltransferase
MTKDIKKVLYFPGSLKAKLNETAKLIDHRYKNKELYILALLDGSFVFAADLVRTLNVSTQIEFVRAKSYKGTESSGAVSLDEHFDPKIFRNKHVLIVDDILDTGLTLCTIKEIIENSSEAASVATCVLLDKNTSKRAHDIQPDFACLQIPDEFVVGYGLDYNGKYRNLPFIGVLDEKVYS